MSKSIETVIIGGGLQGACIALELARLGRRTTIIDQDPLLLNRASLRNEGKIHLGLIYAADPTFSTASIQLQGALNFAPLLQRWLGKAWDEIGISTPFSYLVPDDSIMTPDQLEAHYDRLSAQCRERLKADKSLNYLGHRPDSLAWRQDDAAARRWFNTDRMSAVFETAELAVDTGDLAAVVRRAIDENPLIDVIPGHRVEAIRRTSLGMEIEGRGPDGAFRLAAAQVINCSWDDRFRLDMMMNLSPPPGWLHRMKYRTIIKLPESLRRAPSATGVIGAYGDIVVRPSGTAYLSWYPTGMRGWTHDVSPPKDWNDPCRGQPSAELAREISTSARQHLDQWMPGIAGAEVLTVDAGVIVAYGKTDVDDANSELHDRTRIGVNGGGDYLSVDPGKLTTAPYYAVEAAQAALAKTPAFA